MTDLILQDFSNLSSKNLAQILSNEKKNMFDEQKSDLKRRENKRLCTSPFAGSIGKIKKARREKC